MEVDVKVKCGRCPREVKKTVPVEDAVAMRDNAAKADESRAALVQALMQTIDECADPPDIIVITRNKEQDTTKIDMLADLCNGANNSRSCSNRVKTLVDDIFLRGEKKPKAKPKKAESKEGSGSGETPEE